MKVKIQRMDSGKKKVEYIIFFQTCRFINKWILIGKEMYELKKALVYGA